MCPSNDRLAVWRERPAVMGDCAGGVDKEWRQRRDVQEKPHEDSCRRSSQTTEGFSSGGRAGGGTDARWVIAMLQKVDL